MGKRGSSGRCVSPVGMKLGFKFGVPEDDANPLPSVPGVSRLAVGAFITVGDKVVNGRKVFAHDFGVPGTYGNGYEGVRTGVSPVIVRDEPADSVECVDVVDVVRTGARDHPASA